MKEVVVIGVGDSGSGKSSFGNLYLNKFCFEEGDDPDPCTKDPIFNFNTIDGIMRKYFDTEGHCDGNNVTSQQIQKLAIYLGEKNPLVNSVVVVLNGQCPRFSQGVKDLIKFTYISFGGEKVLGHIAIVFTMCYSVLPNYPNRNKRKAEYKEHTMNYLSKISGIKDIPDVPVFFVDCKDPDGEETKTNLTQFYEWSISREPITLNPELIRHPDDVIEERTFSASYETKNNIKYLITQKRKRCKIIPNNGEPIRYTEWEIYEKHRKAIKKYQKETKTEENGLIERGDYQYQIIQQMERINTIDIKTKSITHGKWSIISTNEVKTGKKKRHGKDIKTIIINGKTGRHDSSFFAFYLNHHTHYIIYEKTYKMEKSFIIDFNGNKMYSSDWKRIEGSNTYRILKQGKERGYSSFGENVVDEIITTQYDS